MKYFANFTANNGTSWMSDHEYTNKQKAIQDVRGCAEAERFQGNEAKWHVWDINNKVVAEGWLDDSGSHRMYDNIGYSIYDY